MIDKICKQCKKKFKAKENRQKFCSMSCAASYNNKKYPKKPPAEKRVCECGKEFISNGHKDQKFCSRECYLKSNKDNRRETLKQTLAESEYCTGFRSSQWAKVRYHARAEIEFSQKELKCERCGYDFHTEICHIKPIKEFEKTATLAEVNALDNLVILCRNCHWEFDHGLLEL